ncbi:AAA family ATPase [Fulvivirgaceae bacterium PWU4]|uniref:AAA family ATPase n=1 Tax=Chryseosolibacter histidini TaxID=2782349 RepID=A0AAP2GHU3_9BACT|nr:AAA family ATPase [Chryseosolibacter histidini]MBT1696429.1 AAA family ATPase [Chryseosolibacter histidini]
MLSDKITGITPRLAADFTKDGRWIRLESFVDKMLTNHEQDLCGVLLSGYAGIGKTYFIENYLKRYELTHPVLIARHREQNAAIPYFGFKLAISDFLFNICNRSSRNEIDSFTASLKEYFGPAFPLLLEYIPEVTILTGEDHHTGQRYTLKIENQLFSLMQSLFSFLADYFKNPVFLFTDDVQWMDASGINLLKHLLLQLPADRIIWIGAYQEHHSNMNPLYHMVEELRLEKKHVEGILIKYFTQDEVRTAMEDILGNTCHHELVDVCFEVSDGNPSHLHALLESLKTTDLIWLEQAEWKCNKEAVKLRYNVRRTDKNILDRLSEVSAITREMLLVVSCMKAVHIAVLTDWLGGDHTKLNELFTEAEQSGLLAGEGNSYRLAEAFSAEVIYKNIHPERKTAIHYSIAKLLYNRITQKLTPDEFILMTQQFDLALGLVRKNNEQQLCADLNYLAGNYSKQVGALAQAQYFFKLSADLLKECKWDQTAEQIYLVYMERAKLEYQLGEFDLAEIHLDYLIEHIKDIHKRAKAFELKIIINNHLGRYRKAVQILKEGLHELSLDLPLEDDLLHREVEQLKKFLVDNGSGAGNMLATEENSKDQKAILKLLYVGGMSLHHTSDVLMTWAALQIIHRSGKTVISEEKAIGYVSYGRMQIIADQIDKGYEFGLKALEINNTLGDISLRCRVYGVYAFYIQPWKKAFHASMEYIRQGREAGKKAGDFIGSYILNTHQLNLHILSGLPLHDIMKLELEETHPEVELTYYITHYQKNLIKFLIGESTIFSIPRLQPSWLAAKFTIQEEKFYRNHVWARYYLLFGYYGLAENAAREADANRKLQEGSPMLPANYMIWFLAITQHWFNYKADRQKALRPVLGVILAKMDLWRTHAPENYSSYWWLLNAELMRIENKQEQALQHYNDAMNTAGSNIYQSAMIAEFRFKYLLTNPGRRKEAQSALLQAQDLYRQWGAVAKVNQLAQQYRAMMPRQHTVAPDISIEMIQHELSGDLEIESLVKKLMVLLLRISGSTAVVIESVEMNGDFKRLGDFSLLPIEGRGSNEEIGFIRRNKLLQAYRSQKLVVINNVQADESFRNDQLHRGRDVQSCIILPVTIRDHHTLIIYLENVFAANWYTEEIIKWIRITANQGAVIIENARIHEVTLKLNEEIREKMSEKERLASEIQSQRDLHLKALVQTQNNERKRIAGDLHDSLGSMLSSVKLRFNSLQDDFVKNLPDKAVRFNDTIKLLDDAVHELRRITHNMLPVSLSRFGLKPSLQTFVDQVNVDKRLVADLQILGLEQRLDEELEVSIYRICQELVQNVIKHAAATTVRIQIIDHEDVINLIVEDNGQGMVCDEINAGLGFTTIESKVKLFKGTFSIESQPGKGTMVLVDIPKV